MQRRFPRFATSRHFLRAALLLAGAATGIAHAADGEAWPVVGRQGIVRLVLVPEAQAKDRAAYAQQIDLLCEPGQTCFLNFYTNTRGVAVAVPLPDEISHEATVTFRRSAKVGAELFRWSCRLQVVAEECF